MFQKSASDYKNNNNSNSYSQFKQVLQLVLQDYLELAQDAAQQQFEVGLWSGQLSLQNVQIKGSAINSLLNNPPFTKPTKPQSTTTTKLTLPPARLKLVSGSIGSLKMNLPWSSLLFLGGQRGGGDVQLELDHVEIVLALESFEEWQERQENQVDTDESAPAAPGVHGVTDDHWTKDKATIERKQNDKGKEQEQQQDPEFQARQRALKQDLLHRAEKLHYHGHDLAAWLERQYQKQQLQKGKEEETKRLKAKSQGTTWFLSSLFPQTWIQNAMNGFLWRFYAGLQTKITNVKIVFVQDSMELGLVVPSIRQVTGGPQQQLLMSSIRRLWSLSSFSPRQQKHQQQRQQSNEEKDHNVRISRRSQRDNNHRDATPPIHNNSSRGMTKEESLKTVTHQSTYDDGEHAIDKPILIRGLSVYIRRQTGRSVLDQLCAPARPPHLGGKQQEPPTRQQQPVDGQEEDEEDTVLEEINHHVAVHE
ncbi:hypothetical protein ACA910_012363 [Epithemia clementina (nom. ined.)]